MDGRDRYTFPMIKEEMDMAYKFTGADGCFRMKDPECTSYLYFPLANEWGVMSSITPDLGGDSKMDQNRFFLPPVSCDNLHNDKSSRNFWCEADGSWFSLTGRSAAQQAELFQKTREPVELEADFMRHTVRRKLPKHDLTAEIRSFVPSDDVKAELTGIRLSNIGETVKKIRMVSAVPIYARSADNIRDHRHVTSLLNRIAAVHTGVEVKPTMSFDERGHRENHTVYGFFGMGEGEAPEGFYPTLEGFIGEGGNLENPGALSEELHPAPEGFRADGFEALGGLVFREIELKPGTTAEYYFAMVYGTDEVQMEQDISYLLSSEGFQKAWDETGKYWQQKVNVAYGTSDSKFNLWMKWVSFQPMLRRIYGCSFLPHHDYGKGGRGWRDLWQDCLALLLMNPSGVREMLVGNCAGVRTDGTNATIIGKAPGEFTADRNHISRVWMDHGAWPFITVLLYIEQTGDLGILFEKQTYFKDAQVCRGEKTDDIWNPSDGQWQKKRDGEVYTGTVLEHLLLQHLTAFFDVGEHNCMRLRDADWNDALDLARERGESVAFTMLYAGNMEQMAGLLTALEKTGVHAVRLMKELSLLIGINPRIYDSIAEKRKLLDGFCSACRNMQSGEMLEMDTGILKADLLNKAAWIRRNVSSGEWIQEEKESGWFNSYYDNHGQKVEGAEQGKIRMMLTGQVFAIMSRTADDEKTLQIIRAADRHLYDASSGGYRLNTDFHELKMDMGRMFGFAYGQKENGAVFSHMTIMYAYALYSRHFSEQAFHVLESLCGYCIDFDKSRIYPGIPEYIDASGRGVYHYLTGAASWMLLTVITQMYGIRGSMGDLLLDPQLCPQQFDGKGEADIQLVFAGRTLHIVYRNPEKLAPGKYAVKEIRINKIRIPQTEENAGECALIRKKELLSFPENEVLQIQAQLGEKPGANHAGD